MECPNCHVDMNDFDFYQDFPTETSFFQIWYYECPNCGKKFAYTATYNLVNEEMEEINEEDNGEASRIY